MLPGYSSRVHHHVVCIFENCHTVHITGYIIRVETTSPSPLRSVEDAGSSALDKRTHANLELPQGGHKAIYNRVVDLKKAIII